MTRFSLQNVRDAEINRVLRQVQDSLNKLAEAQASVSSGLKTKQAHTQASVHVLQSRVSAFAVALEDGAMGRSYTHVQSVPSNVWTITHNLGYHPSVTVVDSTGSEIVGDVTFPSVNTLVATFTASFSGVAYLS